MSRETEIRFTAPAEELGRILRDDALNGFAVGEPITQRLNSLYYDTPELALAKAGLSLRVRKSGRNFTQTVKDASSGALFSERGEFECELPSEAPDVERIPDEEMRTRLKTLAQPENFEPVLETQIRRITRAITSAAGDEIELALDKGEIRLLLNGHGALAVNELELELKRGAPIALYEIARRLSRKTSLTVNVESKSARGLRAVQNEQICSHKPGRAALPEHCTTEDAFAATLSHCLRHMASNIAAVADARLPEGVHQMRVGLRRLRAALAGSGPLFRGRVLQSLRDRAKTLADMFGDTRELDVFATELFPPVEQSVKLSGLPPLRLILDELRRESWEHTNLLVQSDDFTGYLIDLGAAIETRIWREGASTEQLAEFAKPAAEHAAKILDKKLKTAWKRARHLSALNVEERHRLRIALKKLRYSAEFFAPLFPAPAASDFLKRLSRLQDLFGTLNDAAAASAILRRIVEHAGERSSVEFLEAAAFVDGWHQSRIEPTWQKAKRRWKRFVKTEPFWRD